MKRKSRLTLLVTIVMLVSLVAALGITASAAGASSVVIKGVTLNSSTPYYLQSGVASAADRSPADPSIAYFSAATSTLTLFGTQTFSYTGDVISASGDLNIATDANTTLVSSQAYAITVNGNLTISGYGTINAESDMANVSAISADNIDITNTTVTATQDSGSTNGNSQCFGIYATGDFTITDATVTATGSYDGIFVENDITITNSTVVMEGENYGVYSDYGTVTINSGSVTATATSINGDAIYGYDDDGINDIVINGGTVNATGGEAGLYADNSSILITGGDITATATGADSNGIRLSDPGDVNITGGTVTAAGAYDGISVRSGDVNVSGGTVTAEGDESNGIFCNGVLSVSGGTVTGTGGNAGIAMRTESASPAPLTLTNGEAVVTGGQLYSYEYSYEITASRDTGTIFADVNGAVVETSYAWTFSPSLASFDNDTHLFTGVSTKVVIQVPSATPTPTPAPSTTPAASYDSTPKTGDSTGLITLLAIAAAAGTGIAVLSRKKTSAK